MKGAEQSSGEGISLYNLRLHFIEAMLQAKWVMLSLWLTVPLIGALLCSGQIWPQSTQPGMTVQFVARGIEPKPKQILSGDHHDPSPGHVFMIVQLPTNQGIKEEAYGFYCAQGLCLIKGPGMLKSELRCGANDDCNPSNSNVIKRLSESQASVTLPITIDERQKILVEVNKWDRNEYKLTNQNCMDFVVAVAIDLGYPTPPRSMTQTPTEFFDQFKPMAEKEQARRVQAAAEAQQQEEARQEEERENQAQPAPPQPTPPQPQLPFCLTGYWLLIGSGTFNAIHEDITVKSADQMVIYQHSTGTFMPDVIRTFQRSGSVWTGNLGRLTLTLTPVSCSRINTQIPNLWFAR